jgi:predicted ATPase
VRLLERDHPLDVLIDRARRATTAPGGLVLVTGEAGIGKTVLLRAFTERLGTEHRGGPAPLWGLCDPLSTPRPLGPLRDVAAALDPGLPALLREAAAPYEIFAAVLDALRTSPRVLVIEDLHWADEATLDLVRFVARRLATLPRWPCLSRSLCGSLRCGGSANRENGRSGAHPTASGTFPISRGRHTHLGLRQGPTLGRCYLR